MTENDLSSVPNLPDTSEKVSEVLEETVIESTPSEPEQDSVFEELGVSPLEVVKYILIFLLLFGAFVYGGYKVFRVFFPSDGSTLEPITNVESSVFPDSHESSVTEIAEPTSQDTSDVSQIDDLIDQTAPSLKVVSKSLALVFEVQESTRLNSRLENYLLTYKSIKNIYNTDISTFLDASADRELAYFQYVNEYDAALVNLKLSVSSLNSEITYFQDVVTQANLELDSAEKTFFNKVQNIQCCKFIVKRCCAYSNLINFL